MSESPQSGSAAERELFVRHARKDGRSVAVLPLPIAALIAPYRVLSL